MKSREPFECSLTQDPCVSKCDFKLKSSTLLKSCSERVKSLISQRSYQIAVPNARNDNNLLSSILDSEKILGYKIYENKIFTGNRTHE